MLERAKREVVAEFKSGLIDSGLAAHSYAMFRWTLAAVLHPVATFQAVMLIGDQERINRNVDRALSLPKLPIGRERLRP